MHVYLSTAWCQFVVSTPAGLARRGGGGGGGAGGWGGCGFGGWGFLNQG